MGITLITPQSDEWMIYDKAAHRYILTDKAVLDLDGVDLNSYFGMIKDETPGTQVRRFLDFIS